jgi:hypothetical protein
MTLHKISRELDINVNTDLNIKTADRTAADREGQDQTSAGG